MGGRVMSYTPGPWKTVKCECGSPYCKKYGIDKLYIEHSVLNEGDARLIAAAPDMLEALISQAKHYNYDRSSERMRVIAPILEKATGKTWEEIREERE
jgi:hypothetical protein